MGNVIVGWGANDRLVYIETEEGFTHCGSEWAKVSDRDLMEAIRSECIYTVKSEEDILALSVSHPLSAIPVTEFIQQQTPLIVAKILSQMA